MLEKAWSMAKALSSSFHQSYDQLVFKVRRAWKRGISSKVWTVISHTPARPQYTTSLVAAREKVDIRQAYLSTSIYCLIAIIEHCLAPNSKRTCKSMRQLSTFSDQLLLTTTLLADFIFAVFELVSYRYLVKVIAFSNGKTVEESWVLEEETRKER